MLNWSNLSQSQRLLCSFFCLFAALCVLVPLFAHPFTTSGALAGVAVGLAMLAILLNPAFLRRSPEAFTWSKLPSICRFLYAAAAIALVVRSIV